MSAASLFTPYVLGDLVLPNRTVMAPMTRSRAGEGLAPTALNAEYYAQRASAGLLITEGTQVSQQGIGYIRTPGIHTPAQVAGWRLVTDAVHAAGGRIYAQLWHVGRVSHSSFQPDGGAPVAASALPIPGVTWTAQGQLPFTPPRALELHEIPGVIDQYVHGAACAKEAGFDGVELHGANGYLIDTFLRDGSNHRTDAYGGSLENRARFLQEIVEGVAGVWPRNRMGVRLSLTGTFNSMSDSDPAGLLAYLATALDGKLGYLHLIDAVGGMMAAATRIAPVARSRFHGTLIVNGGFSAELAQQEIRSGAADLVSFGVPFLANPDLPKRLETGAELNAPRFPSFYTEGAEGYTDYPALG